MLIYAKRISHRFKLLYFNIHKTKTKISLLNGLVSRRDVYINVVVQTLDKIVPKYILIFILAHVILV